jgi:hypothetical protein
MFIQLALLVACHSHPPEPLTEKLPDPPEALTFERPVDLRDTEHPDWMRVKVLPATEIVPDRLTATCVLAV